MAKTFAQLDREYDVAHQAWAAHVDDCEVCERSDFACERGQQLHEEWNAAWNAAKRAWDRMKAGRTGRRPRRS
jgi:hypothetical protein